MSRSKDATPVATSRRLLTRSEAAGLLGVSPGTLSRWAAERIGPPFVKLGPSDKSSVRYPADQLDEFIAVRTKHPK
jgi:predicted DNA-binding transcriptional regulator AlpA